MNYIDPKGEKAFNPNAESCREATVKAAKNCSNAVKFAAELPALCAGAACAAGALYSVAGSTSASSAAISCYQSVKSATTIPEKAGLIACREAEMQAIEACGPSR